MKINNVTHIGIIKSQSYSAGTSFSRGDLAGFFTDVKTCDTIEDGLKSFDELAERNKKRRVIRSFEYK